MEKDFRFNLEEAAGAIGDYGTLIPIIVGVAKIVEINLSLILFFFGISYIATGIYYKLPMPVEPMKVIGALAIGGSLTAGEIAGAGIVVGIILLFLGRAGRVVYIQKVVPRWMVRGIQLGLTLILLQTALNYIGMDLGIGFAAVAIIAFFSLTPVLDVSSLVVLGLGLGIGIYNHGLPPMTGFSLPGLMLPSLEELGAGFWKGALPQLPLTLGNAVLATSLLVVDLFDREVAEEKLVTSMGLMCLISSPLGGFPMCHGAGGLAAQYRFGARTGGSNIISGVILLVIAFFFASPMLIDIIPYGVLGALLLFTAGQLFRSAMKTEDRLLAAVTGGLAFITNIGAAFVIMFIFYVVRKKFMSHLL